jgi:hypothetical protein
MRRLRRRLLIAKHVLRLRAVTLEMALARSRDSR